MKFETMTLLGATARRDLEEANRYIETLQYDLSLAVSRHHQHALAGRLPEMEAEAKAMRWIAGILKANRLALADAEARLNNAA